MSRRRQPLLYETELSWFLLLGTLDVILTWLILRYSAHGQTHSPLIEGNPVARRVLHRWGIRGMVVFKFLAAAVVCVIAEIVGRVRPRTGRMLLLFGNTVLVCVVVYSLRLLLTHLR
ncbi:MAG: hypothetical protein KDA89_21180 [Planctomycetaceae bacterium]|nr:hypothetical protein [Planctomycetaceae bacterium]